MASKLHPDKKSVIYGEYKPIIDVFAMKAEAETEANRKVGKPPVSVPELIRRATLKAANKILAEYGMQTLDLDPSASPTAHRGERFDEKSGTLKPVEAGSRRTEDDEQMLQDPAMKRLFKQFVSMVEKEKPRRRMAQK